MTYLWIGLGSSALLDLRNDMLTRRELETGNPTVKTFLVNATEPGD